MEKKIDPTLDVLRMGRDAGFNGITIDDIFTHLKNLGYDIPEKDDNPSWNETTGLVYRPILERYFESCEIKPRHRIQVIRKEGLSLLEILEDRALPWWKKIL
ncbi:MAG: hypothetical protein OEY10_00110 [Nitrosopumilus sp.]|nr:hypothetical protein [Nitrosopumilus sp.]